MTFTDGAPNNRQPFPLGYLVNPAEDVVWDNLWANRAASDGVGLQDHYAAGLQHIARAFADAPGLLGLEILNEPWPGSRWPTCANPVGCLLAGFDQRMLTGFYRRVISALHSADPTHLIVYEPNLLFDFGAATQLGRLNDQSLVFAFHNYCLGAMPGEPALPDPMGLCGINENLVFGNAQTRTSSTGDALLMDEWGNTANTTLLNRMAAEADQHMVGWTYWAYEDCCGSPGAIVKDGTKSPTAPGNLNLPVLDALARPYPQAVAGTPTAWTFDPVSKRFQLAYSTKPVAGGSFPGGTLTRVQVPRRQYPGGYTVAASGATAVSAPDADTLLLATVPGATAVTLTVTPA
jgi:endoglycosylceramidase